MSTENNNNQIAKATPERTVADNVLTRVSQFQNQGDLKLPTNYSAENAVRSAWLMIQEVKNLDNRPALEVCSKESIATALLDMVLQGLNPVKKQCYFIVRGNKLQLQRSYMGTMSVSKRVANIKEIRAVAVYDGDTFKYKIEGGKKHVTEHEQSLDFDPKKVKGAYAIITYNDGSTRAEIMNIQQIRQAWEQGPTKGKSPAHNNFPDEMACKTVINRALKVDIGSSDDADLYDEELVEDATASYVKNEIDQNANRTEIGFSHDEIAEEVPDETEVPAPKAEKAAPAPVKTTNIPKAEPVEASQNGHEGGPNF